MTKYRAIPTEIDGYRFDSKAEANRYCELKLMDKAHAISGLVVHPKYTLCSNGEPLKYRSGRIVRYEADFAYRRRADGIDVIEDVKGVATDAFKLKLALMDSMGMPVTVVGVK